MRALLIELSRGIAWAAVPRRAAVLAGTAAAVLGWSRASFAAGDKEGAGEPEITDKVYFEFKISGRTKALENPKWEKIIARDKRGIRNRTIWLQV